MNIKTKYILQCLFLSVMLGVGARSSAEEDGAYQKKPGDTLGVVTPPLRWKYGWKDGNKANTIGSLRGKDAAPAVSAPPSSGYSPSQIAAAYGFNKIAPAGDGRGQTIAVVVAYGSPNIQSDLTGFCSAYGITNAAVSIYYPQGKPSTVNVGWAQETTLDVEWAHAMAPGAKIAVVVAKDATLGSLLTAVSYAASTVRAGVISMSWGAAEFPTEKNYDSYFSKSGVSYVASSGDTGAIVDWPAVSSNVVSVGGTSLKYDPSSGTVTSETVWAGSGGGVSKYVQIPAYQLGFNVNSGRGNPDVSYVADPYTGVQVYFTDPTTGAGGWYVFGGTSAGAPQWAALLARRASLGNAGTIPFNVKAYGAAKSTTASYFRDITSGSSGYPALSGYDLATGLGSPLANQVVTISK
jgi:subtilase family serine protease